MLRELYEKHGENKDIKKSLSHLLNHKQSASKGTPKREDYDTVNCSRGELAENINHPIPTDYKGSTSVQSIL